MVKVIHHMSRGRRLLIALLNITTARDVAARVRSSKQRVADWSSGHRSPRQQARELLEQNYGIPRGAWAQEWREPE